MLIFLSLFVSFLSFAVFFVYNLVKRNRKRSAIFGAALLLVCCLFGAFVYITGNGYSYKLSIAEEKLEAFIIDLDTPQQYEEWFCPDKRIVTVDGHLYLTKGFAYSYDEPLICLTYYTDVLAAKKMYDLSLSLNEKNSRGKKYTAISRNADYEYYFSDIHTYTRSDHLFGLFPEGEYSSEVGIRYKNVVFSFSETSRQRESRIGEAIDQLLADYEQYLQQQSPRLLPVEGAPASGG